MLALLLMGIMTTVVSAQVGVKAGDWIKYGEISITGTGVPAQFNMEWIKMEITGIQGNTVNVTATSHPKTGSETTQTLSGDVSAGTGTLSFFLIPANLTKGDPVPVMGMGMLTVTNVVTRTCAGASRSTVCVEYGIPGASMGLYWDQATGVMTEMRMEVTTPTTYTMTMKATESNMWEAGPAGSAIDPTYLYILAAVIVVIAAVTIALVMRRKKPPEAVTPPPSTPSIQP